MADSSSRTAVSIIDLPEEILETIALYLPPNDIITLRFVNSYFNTIFDYNKYWKSISYYSKKYFLCDLRSDSSAPGIKEAVERISLGDITEWKGYHKLLKTHIKNWNSEQIQNYDTIPWCGKNAWFLKEIVNEHHEHLLLLGVDYGMQLWNITAEPRSLWKVVCRKSVPKWLPEGNLLMDTLILRKFRIMAVLQLQHPSYIPKLKYKFAYHMGAVLAKGEIPSIVYFSHSCYIVMGNCLIGYTSWTPSVEGNLHIWDLASGTKLATVELAHCDLFSAFRQFVQLNTHRDKPYNGRDYFEVSLYPGEFPCVIVVFEYLDVLLPLRQVNIFNVKTLQFTHLVDQLSTHITYCSMFRHTLCIKGVNLCGTVEKSNVSIYNIHNRPLDKVPSFCNNPAGGVPVQGELLRFIGQTNSDHLNIHIKHSKLFVNFGSEIHVMSLESVSPITKLMVTEPFLHILGFMEPGLLLMYDRRCSESHSDVVVYSILNGKRLFAWINVYIDRFMEYFKHLEYPSKLVLSFKGEREFKKFDF